MKIFKNIIVSALILLVMPILIATGAYLFVSDTTLVPLMSDYLESATGTRITYHHDATITRTLSPSFHVTNLAIEDKNKGFSAQISELQLQVSLLRLFSGKLDVPFLILGDTRIEIKQSGPTTTLSIPESLPIIPIFHDVQISRLTINHDGENIVSSAHLNELSLSLDPETDKLVTLVEFELAGTKVHINAELPPIHEVLKTKQLTFVASAKSSDIDLTTKGNIDFMSSPPSVQASAGLQAPDLQHISTGVKDFVVQGSLVGQATIAGTFEQLAVKDISATWQGPQQSVATMHGAIDNVMQMSGCDLKVDSHLEGGTWLAPVLPESMGPLQSADITAWVSCIDQQLKIGDFSLRAKTMDELDLSLSGQLNVAKHEQGGMSPEEIDLKLKFSAPATRTARLLLFEKVWEFGPITGTANIRSTNGDPGIEEISISTRDPKGIEVDLTGRINKFPLDPHRPNTGFDLAVTMKSNQTTTMMERLGLELPLPGPLQITYKIEGDTQALQLNEIKLRAGKTDEIHVVSTGGRLLFGNWALDDPLTNIDLSIQATSSDTHALGTLWGKPLPELGALSAQGLVHTVSGKHRIDNFQLVSSERSPLQASIKGSADHVAFFGQPGIHGIQLRAAATASDTVQLNSLFDFQREVPAMGPFNASGDITGEFEKLTISNFTASAGKEETLLIDVHGAPGIFSAANDWRPKETNLSISARSTSSHSFFDLLDLRLPELGTITANAELIENDNKIMLESTSIVLGDATNPSLDASGHINDLMAFAGVDFDMTLNLAGDSLAALAGNIKLPDMKPLTGKIVISDSDGTLGIDTFQIMSIDDNLFSIDVTGHFDDFKHPDTLAMTTHLTARDLHLIGALFDAQWPEIGPVQLDSEIQSKGKALEFNTTFMAGELKLHSEISGLFHTNPPQISGKITAQNFFLPDFAEFRDEDTGSEKPRKDKIFSPDPINFNWLKKADLDLSLEIDSFDDQRSQAQSGLFKFSVQSGELKISPARLVFPKGELNFDIELDVREQPKVRLEAYGKNLNPWLALNMESSAANKDFDTDLDIEVKVTSSGLSEKELAANLQGEIYLNMKNGKMRRSLLDLVFLDFVGWTVSKVARDKYVDVECGVADFSIKDGTMDTKGLFIDVKAISIAGEGTIDLANEEIDYVFLPKKKSNIFNNADPVNIKGPLNNPSVTTLPVKSAIITYGTLFFAPYLYAGGYATSMISGMSDIGENSFPCLEYDRKHAQEDQAVDH